MPSVASNLALTSLPLLSVNFAKVSYAFLLKETYLLPTLPTNISTFDNEPLLTPNTISIFLCFSVKP